MIRSTDIDFTRITPIQFEELCFKLIYKLGYEKVRWRQGAADSGRDIQAIKIEKKTIVGMYTEEWFFEAKHYQGGVPPKEFESKFAWANAKKPHHLVFLLTTHITNAGDNYFENRISALEYHTHLVQGNELKEILVQFPDLIREFNLLDNHIDIINSIKELWVINDKIPNWTQVLTAIQASNIALITQEEKLFLAALMIIHNDKNTFENHLGEKDDQLFLDHLYPIIHSASNDYINNTKDEIEFNNEIWEQIEWIEEKNYGELEEAEKEESLWQHGLINLIKFQDIIGILGVITGWENDKQVIKPFFISKDSSLSLIRFKAIDSDIDEFIETYKKYRPKEPEVEGVISELLKTIEIESKEEE